MLPQIPQIIPLPFAQSGQKNNISTDPASGSDPAASWSGGFPPITMIPREAGGKPPYGQDFNGILYQLSDNLYFAQSGSLYPWNATLNYLAGAHVQGSNGTEYVALVPSGPDSPAPGGGYVGAKNPVTDTTKTYWTPLKDLLAADLQLKANTGLDNVTTVGAERMAHAAMPSTRYTELALPASGGRVTVPADGWIYFAKEAGIANRSVALNVYSQSNVFQYSAICFSIGSSNVVRVFLPVSKGYSVEIAYDATGTTTVLRFIYANGS